MSKAIAFTVSGRVQGVGFRYATANEARSLQLSGWVRNEPDGSVAGEAQGMDDQISRFESFLKRGPASARVDHLDVHLLSSEKASDLPDGFEIRK
ncbi:hypothetical protein OC834_001173 [Tilletia horrida]|nr:hypothetical protein OC834_001173 [Tilletia horrida]